MGLALHPALEHRFNTVRELYAEFFLLLDQSVSEEPAPGRGASLDRTIDLLMKTIEQEMGDFRREVDHARATGALDGALSETILTFDAQLREALKLLSECVTRRIAQLGHAREELKGRLTTMQAKKRGARGYRGAAQSGRLVESHI
jgi:hypothetical protein